MSARRGGARAGRAAHRAIERRGFHDCALVLHEPCRACTNEPLEKSWLARRGRSASASVITGRTDMIFEGDHQIRAIMKAETTQSQESIPAPACPGCGMIKNEWPGEGYTHDRETYCCQGCAEGTGCTCVTVGKPGFSRQGQKLTRAEPRPGEQRSGAPAPKGELSGERDNLGTAEALDQGG